MLKVTAFWKACPKPYQSWNDWHSIPECRRTSWTVNILETTCAHWRHSKGSVVSYIDKYLCRQVGCLCLFWDSCLLRWQHLMRPMRLPNGVNLLQGKRLQISAYFCTLYSERGFSSALTNAFELWRATVRLQTGATDFEWCWTKSNCEGAAWWTTGVMKSWPIPKAKVLSGPPHSTAFQEMVAWEVSCMVWCSLTTEQVSQWPPDALPLVCPFLKKANTDFGCTWQVAEASAASPLPACLPTIWSSSSLAFWCSLAAKVQGQDFLV